MNYRGGLQRIYAVLTVAWIAVVLFTVLDRHWEPWLRFQRTEFYPWEVTEAPLPAPPPGYKLDTPARTFTDADIDVAATEKMQAHQRWTWAAGLSTIPPLVAYLTLFVVVPWIYRGFKPTPPSSRGQSDDPPRRAIGL